MEHYPGITNENPKHPDYSMIRERLATFRDRQAYGISCEQLANAGFYATGHKDSVRCFFCGGGIKSCLKDEDPWLLHAECFPYCEYLKLCMGENFINTAHARELGMQILEENAFEPEKRLVPDQLIEDLNSKASRLLIDKGYVQEDIERAIQRTREKHGGGELQAHTILESLLESSTKSTHRSVNLTVSSNGLFEPQAQASGGSSNDYSIIPRERTPAYDRDQTEQERLLEENRNLKDRMICKICMDKDACIVFIPCGHMVSCMGCANRQSKCGVCRADIKESVRTYCA